METKSNPKNMKTLIIAGTAKIICGRVQYNVALYGQSASMPLVQYITSLNFEASGYNELQDVARAKYAKYFNTDLFNIISLENIVLL